ncbi:MAG: hypothetical protein K2G32_01855 [Oscillospiraceae bacterium]|nr:hypothetical protein [Oscillospiraceae bacterium]
MDNIEDMLRALTEDSPEDGGDNEDSGQSEEQGGLFDNINPDMLIKLMTLFGSMNQQDDNERFLLALKPLLGEEKRRKVDTAVKMMKLFALLPILKESGLFGGG